MEKYIWLFPIIFHDMEEIIGFGIWLKNNKKLLGEKYPRILSTYKDFSTEGFALAVFEELVVCIAVSALALADIDFIKYIWLGAFAACTLHFVIHIGQAVVLKQYIPATATSVICLPISVWILYRCFSSISGNWLYAAASIALGIVLVAVNLKFAQKLIGMFTRKAGIPPIV